jgi:hypothetical protein
MRFMVHGNLSFGDTVRIRTSEFTETFGLAGRTGLIQGFTTPSMTGVDVIGNSTRDWAVAVTFEIGTEPLWFAEDLIEFVHHTPGTELRLGTRHYVRDEDGEWQEIQ